GPAEDRISIWIGRLGFLIEEAQPSLTQHMIDLDGRNLGDPRRRINLDVVHDGSVRVRPLGHWKQALNFHCNRIEPIPWNDVAGKWIAEERAVGGCAGSRGIVDHAFQHLPSEGIDADDLRTLWNRAAEVTVAVRQ